MGYTENLCTGGTPYAESQLGAGQAVSYAFDGNTGTYWQCATSASPADTWVAYLFATAQAIARVRTYGYAGDEARDFKDFKIQGSTDTTNGADGTWVDLATGQNMPATAAWTNHDFANSTSYKGIRLYGAKQYYNVSYPYVLHINEIEMMGFIADGGFMSCRSKFW